eukprot:3275509-Heterocapsa_arctica.AAC.1
MRRMLSERNSHAGHGLSCLAVARCLAWQTRQAAPSPCWPACGTQSGGQAGVFAGRHRSRRLGAA